MNTLNVQMKDFSDFFLKENSKIDACFAGCNVSTAKTNFQKGNIENPDREKRFFDINKVFKEIEQKELR
jgi:hypothetical protein